MTFERTSFLRINLLVSSRFGDPNRMEQVYETNAVDVDDVEVTRDED